MHSGALMSQVCIVLLRNGHLFVVEVVVFVEYKVSEFFGNITVTITSYGFMLGSIVAYWYMEDIHIQRTVCVSNC